MKKILALSCALMSSGAALAGQVADNATIAWQETQCVAISRLDDSAMNGAAGDYLLERAKPRLKLYYNQLKANAITKSEWGKIGGNLEASANKARDADDFVYVVLADYAKKLQQMRREANYAPDNLNAEFYYSMLWVNSSCDALIALDK
ncbi:hypothetical protein ORL36_16410 [Klebsiella pasteurii]|uniref:hypothetical protein n=1 Tax=Klebsiella TaxID=570 RepID=UPI0022466469|nr:hypothetical protein [Klebsiella pasteurii]MCW9586199.1 hypothetical protein [Klebsiella pasteurii]